MAYTDVLVYANIALALLLMVASVLYIIRYRNRLTWIKGLYAFVGLYWLCIYVTIYYCGNMCVKDFIRPCLTFALGVVATGALYRVLAGIRT